MKKKKQVVRGHNIVTDGWAGAHNPKPDPNPTSNHSCQTLTHPHTYNNNYSIINARFSRFQLERDGQTDGPTDASTDAPTDGQARPIIELRVRN